MEVWNNCHPLGRSLIVLISFLKSTPNRLNLMVIISLGYSDHSWIPKVTDAAKSLPVILEEPVLPEEPVIPEEHVIFEVQTTVPDIRIERKSSLGGSRIDIMLMDLKTENVLKSQVNVSGKDHLALFDFGTTASLIKSSLVSQELIQPDTSTISGLGRDIDAKCTGLATVHFSIGPLNLKQDLVIPDEYMKYPVVLGLNFLQNWS